MDTIGPLSDLAHGNPGALVEERADEAIQGAGDRRGI